MQFDKRILADKRFQFLTSTPLPTVSFANVNDVIYLISEVANYTAAHSIALDSFSVFRVDILKFIIKLKEQSLRLGANEPDKTKGLVFDGVVFDTFNMAQQHLTTFHEEKIKKFTTNYYKLVHMNARDYQHNAQLIATNLRRSLNGYELKMKKMKGAIRSSLAMLYAMHIKGI